MALIQDYFEKTKTYKETYGEKTVVLMQVGAFYEVYGLRDPKTLSISGSNIVDYCRIVECSIANKKVCVGHKDVIMAGFRDYMIEKYIRLLEKAAYTTVVYSQDNMCKNTTRSLSGIFSPGTTFSNDSENNSNNIMCIWVEKFEKIQNKFIIGVSSIDVFTGQSFIKEINETYFENPTTYDELEKIISIYNPNETIIISNTFDENKMEEIINFSTIKSKKIRKIYLKDNSTLSNKASKCENQNYQKEVFNIFWDITDINMFFETQQFNEFPIATQSLCFLLNFIYTHNQNLVKQIEKPIFSYTNNHLILANHSLKQLNIIGDDKKVISSVYNFLNRTKTIMGNRKMNFLICNPIIDSEQLTESYKTINFFINNTQLLETSRKLLENIPDLEKIFRKLILSKITPSDIVKISKSMSYLNDIENLYKKNKIHNKYFNNSNDYFKLSKFIDKNLIIDKCSTIETLNFEENLFQKGIYKNIDKEEEKLNNNLDKLNAIQQELNNIIASSEKSNKKEDVQYVKINKTEQMGYSLLTTSRRGKLLKENLKNKEYIDIHLDTSTFKLDINKGDKITLTKANSTGDKINHHIIDEVCKNIIKSQSIIKTYIKDAYCDFCRKLITYQNNLITAIDIITNIDIDTTKSYISNKYNYCSPEIDMNNSKSFIDATDLRHILVEHINENEIYIPNDITLGKDGDKNGIILFGTNAVGKSCLIKSIGISIIMAQCGFYVPCKSFTFKPYNKLFTRILGNDNIFKGMSTFVVEMSELNNILNIADENSLILGDELCSGTESSSAISIFSAGIIELSNRNSTFLFATHFHEILDIENVKQLETIHIMHMAVIYDTKEDILIYDRKLKPGPGNKIYGLEVCKSLNLPTNFLDLANSIRIKRDLNNKSILEMDTSKYNNSKIKTNCEMCGKPANDIHHLQHQKEANDKNFIKTFHKNHKANLMSLCEECHNNFHKTDKQHKKVKTSKGTKIVALE
jgi:DNA mismatch repair protein MutS